MKDMATLTVDDFAATVGTRYATDAGPAGPTELELVSADAVGDAGPGVPRAPFSLVFLGPPDHPLGQGTHALQHPALGELEIFLVPIAPDADGRRYEAVFA
jgi:hypothetical protein